MSAAPASFATTVALVEADSRAVAEPELFESMAPLGWTATRDGAVVHFSARWRDYTGISSSQSDAPVWHSVVHAEDLREFSAGWPSALERRAVFDLCCRLRRHDGEFRWFKILMAPSYAGADLVRWVGTATDIDEQRQSEVSLRTAVRVREDLLAIVSHDLRNSLNAVLMASAQIDALSSADDDTGKRIRKCSAIVAKGVGQMNRLVSDLLDTAKLTVGQTIAVDLEIVDVAELVDQLMETFDVVTAKRRLALTAHFTERPIFAFCDADRIVQVLENLIGNAIKFTRDGGAIRVDVTRVGADVQLSVNDNGIGIRADQVAHIFDPYWKADAERKRGAGLGLAIVKAVVEAHHGRVWVDTKEGQGTTFSFTVPQSDNAMSTEEDPK